MKNFKRCYNTHKEKKERKKFATFDLETKGLGGDVLAASYAIEQGPSELIIEGDIISQLVRVILSYPFYLWYAHNAQYDWRYLIPEFEKRRIDFEMLMRTDNDVFCIQIKRNDDTITLLDSFALVPISLRDFAKSFSTEQKGHIDFENVVFDAKNPKHRDYALRDSRVLLESLINYDKKIMECFGVHVGYTAASTAVKAWRVTIPEHAKYFNDEKNEVFIREAYYGGLVFLTDVLEHDQCETYDINSCYPYVMRACGVPYGSVTRVGNFNAKYPGIYRVVVSAPKDLVVPILPCRERKGAMKFTRWPSGTFETVCTSEELKFAIEKGYKILEVLEGLVWEKIIYPFSDFVNKAEKLRKEFKGRGEELAAKLMQNSLYGKFGARRERRKIFKPSNPEECLGASPWDKEGKYWWRREVVEDMLCLPQWAAWITAQARLHLLRAAYRIGVKNVFYGDTDSLTIQAGYGNELKIDSAYGAWKLEKVWSCFRAVAPKVYVGILDDTLTGRAKGLPRKKMNTDLWRAIYDDIKFSVPYTSLPKFIQTLRGEGKLIQRHRGVTDLMNSHNWRVDSLGNVRPKIHDEKNNGMIFMSASK